MVNWFKENKKNVIRFMFLIPIILVMIISISHVVSWYNMANPFTWAIYLSVAIEIAAMSSIAAASVRLKGGVWLVFILVTFIQFIGNIFFCYKEIDITNDDYKSWVELTSPIFEMLGSDIKDISTQKRWLSLLEGGLLPIISLSSLHFFIKYNDAEEQNIEWKGKVTRVSENTYTDEKLVEEPILTEVQVEETVENQPIDEEETVIENNVSEVVDVPKSVGKVKNKKNPLALNTIRRLQNLDKWA